MNYDQEIIRWYGKDLDREENANENGDE